MGAEDALQFIGIASEDETAWVASEDLLDFNVKVPLDRPTTRLTFSFVLCSATAESLTLVWYS